MSKRKAFNFLRSYFDVYNMLDNDKDKKQFIEAVMNRQFNGIEPIELSKMASFAYNSQKHSIDKSVKGFEDKTKIKLSKNQAYNPPTQDPCQGGAQDPSQQEKEEEKEKEEYTNNSAEDKSSTPQIDFKKLLDYINTQTKRTGKEKFRVINKSIQAKYKARLKDGYTNQDIANAIKNAAQNSYHIETNYTYLTPEFFSKPEKIDKYGFKSKYNNKKVSKENFISNPYTDED